MPEHWSPRTEHSGYVRCVEVALHYTMTVAHMQTALYDAKCVVLEREAKLASQDKRIMWLETVAQDLQSEIRSLPNGNPM